MARTELAVGIDLGGTNMTVGVVDRRGKLHGRARKKTKAHEGRDAVLDRIVSAVDAACAEAKVRPADLEAVGIGAPGPVYHERGVVIAAGNLGWRNVPLGELLRKRLGVRVSVDNDANVAAWGEATVGAGAGCDSLLAVWVGTGVGAGIVVNRSIWRGDLFTAGEIGHVVAFANGMPGSRTVEDFCSRTGVVRSLTALAGLHPDSLFHRAMARHVEDGKAGPLGSGAIAECYEAAGDFSKAIGSYEKTDRVPDSYFRMARCHRKLKQFGEAESLYQFIRAHHTDPAPEASIQLGYTYEEWGKRERAIKTFQLTCKNFPKSSQASQSHSHLQSEYNINITLGGAKDE